MDGPYLSLAIQNRKKAYEDDTCTIWYWNLGEFIGIDTRIEVEGTPTLSNYKHWKKIMAILEDDLREANFEMYIACVDSVEKFRWCEWLGFESTYITMEPIELMFKEL